MEEAELSAKWKELDRRIDEISGLLARIQASIDNHLVGALDAIRASLADVGSADNWDHMDRRIDEVFGMLNALLSEIQRSGAPCEAAASDRGLFVIGHARSGTTVLADALNTSDDICCLMEPYFYRSIDKANFADSFNDMHRGFGNPPIKGYWVPSFRGATGRGVVSHLRKTYRYVGEKLALRQREKDYDPDRFLEFAVEELHKSPFICVIRDPIKVTSSVIDLFESSDFSAPTIAALVRSQLETYLLILRLVSLVPSFYLLVHENVDRDVLASLGSHLEINLERAAAVYLPDFKRTPHTEEAERILADDAGVKSLQEIYSRLKDLLDTKSVKIRADKYADCRRLCEAVAHLL